jgi:hypothetical protein
LALERRGEGHLDRLPQLVADLAQSKVELIIALDHSTVLAGKEGALPVVEFSAGDPVATGLTGHWGFCGSHEMDDFPLTHPGSVLRKMVCGLPFRYPILRRLNRISSLFLALRSKFHPRFYETHSVHAPQLIAWLAQVQSVDCLE